MIFIQFYEIYLYGMCLPYLISLFFKLFQLFQSEYQALTSSCTQWHVLFAATTSSRRLRLELRPSVQLQRDQRLKQRVRRRTDGWLGGGEELFTVGWSSNSWRGEHREWDWLGKWPDLMQESGEKACACTCLVLSVRKHICEWPGLTLIKLRFTFNSWWTDQMLGLSHVFLVRWYRS